MPHIRKMNFVNGRSMTFAQKNHARRTSWHLIRQNSRLRLYWDLVIILLSLWNCFTLPVDVAFQPPIFAAQGNLILNYFIDLLFLIDMIFNFRTTIANDLTGEEIYDSKKIATTYLKRRFLVDLFATIPLDLIVSIVQSSEKGDVSHNLSLLSMLKIVRILRFTRIISYLNTTQDVKLSLKLIKLVFYLSIYLHWQACLWFFYTKWDRTWYPLTDLIEDHYTFYDSPVSTQYSFSLWHSVSILVAADMVPATESQAAIVSILVIISEFVHANILGTISVIIQSMSRKTAKFQEQIEFATSTMKTIKLNEGIQRRVLEYISSKFVDIDAYKDLDNLMMMLSPSLRHQVTRHLFQNSIKQIHYLETNPDVVDFLLRNIEAVQFLPDDYIIKQGSKPTHMYFLAQG